MRRGGLFLVWLTGCAQLAGIDETSSSTPEVTLAFERVSIGTTVVRSPLPLDGLSATWLVPDPALGFAEVPATLRDGTTWVANVTDPAGGVLFALPDERPRLWQLPHRDLVGTYTRLEHPDAQPASSTAMVELSLTLDTPYVAGQGLQVYTVGVWTERNLSGAELPAADTTQVGPLTYPWSSSTALARFPHERMTMADAFLVLRYTGNQLIGAFTAPPFEQGEVAQITGTVATLPLDQTLDATIDSTALAMRYTATRPAMGAPAIRWNLHAAPGHELAVTTGPRLHAGAVDAPATQIAATYANPFADRGWRSLLHVRSRAARSYAPAGSLPVTLAAGSDEYVAPTPGQTIAQPAGIPLAITIGETSLSTDGVMLPMPTAPVEVAFIPDIPENTLYAVELYELVPDAAMTELVHEIRLSATASAPRFLLPPSVFEPGKLYTLRMSTQQGGYPALASGDLATRSLPHARAFMDSGVFQVVAP